MKRKITIFIIGPLLFLLPAIAQVKLVLQLKNQPSKTDSVFLAGNINGWQPDNKNYLFNKAGQLALDVKQGSNIEFKLTRGSWQKVETGLKGQGIANRQITITRDTLFPLEVLAWQDFFEVEPKKNTASKNVLHWDSAFYMPQLNRYRAIDVYLPPDYKTTKKRYPVLYLQDGQNCFSEHLAGYGEWKADEIMDHYFDSLQQSMIIIAIHHGGNQRMQEYNPYDHDRFGKGEGKAYVQFLAETLKPAVDKAFRTKKQRKFTAIAGSSMGGVISMWATMAYPTVFGIAGVFSPAFWTAEQIFVDAAKTNLAHKRTRFFLYAGGKEGETMVPQTRQMFDLLQAKKRLKTKLIIDDAAAHNEAAWQKYFDDFIIWLKP